MCGIGQSVEDQPCNLRKCKEPKAHKTPQPELNPETTSTSIPLPAIEQELSTPPPLVVANNTSNQTRNELEHISKSAPSAFPFDRSLLSFFPVSRQVSSFSAFSFACS